MCTKTIPDIDDWSATCSIYDICEKKSVEALLGGQAQVSLDLPVGIHPSSTVLVRQTSVGKVVDLDAQFGIQLISSPDEIPIFHIVFRYDVAETGDELISVEVSFLKYPSVWPWKAEKPWLRWVNEQASQVLAKMEISYAVCEWIEYSSINFFGVVVTDTNHEFTAVTCFDYPLHACDKSPFCAVYRLGQLLNQTKKENNSLPLAFAENMIISNWKKWVRIECPICFDVFFVAEATEITCGHFYCTECISMFAKTIVSDIKGKLSNPFKCPVTSCRRDMEVVSCVKKLLPEEEWNIVERWLEDVKYPPANMLKTCIKKSCGKGQMRHEHPGSTFTFCELCKWQCCEVCMLRPHRGGDCDASQIVQLCVRYNAASDKIKRKCEGRWPWIKEYAISRAEDIEAVEWVKKNASFCPKCKCGIERSAGCFHMICRNCETHFCYECGDELSYPYYGTHHCWEERNDFQFDED